MRFGAARVVARAMEIATIQCASVLRLSPSLPPGSLGPRGIARFGNHSFYQRAFQRYGPVFKVLWNRNLTICIVGFDRARRLLAIHGRVLAQLTIDITPLVPMGFLRGMAEEQHDRYRPLILTAMRNELAAACGGLLRELIRSELAELARCAKETVQADRRVLTPCLHRLATRCLLIAFFGERPGDDLFATLERGFDSLSTDGVVVHIGDAQRRGFADLQACTKTLFEHSRSTNRAAVCVLDRLSAQHDERAIDDTMIGNLIYMVELGRYDIRSLLRWVIKHLSDHPTADVSLARACVLETLRLEQIDALNRIATVNFEFDGFRIPAGAAVRVLLRESHRDPAAFETPDAYRPCRFATIAPASRNYAPFGLGEHRCVAAEFVLDFATMCVEELLTGFTWTVASDGASEKLSHAWEPANNFEIALRPRCA
jgi:cytochrome P450